MDDDYDSFEISTYASQPILIALPADGRIKTQIQCENCREPVRVRLWAKGARPRARLRLWQGFGVATAAFWSLFGLLASADSSSELFGFLTLLGSIGWPLALVIAFRLYDAPYGNDDNWVEILGRGRNHLMLEPGQREVRRMISDIRDYPP